MIEKTFLHHEQQLGNSETVLKFFKSELVLIIFYWAVLELIVVEELHKLSQIKQLSKIFIIKNYISRVYL